MRKVSRTKAAAAAEVLFRYMVARYRCVGGPLSAGRVRLADEIRQGIQVFEGAIVIDADAPLHITGDREHHSFFRAIVNGFSQAVPEIEPAELVLWRNYVMNGGPIPRRREPMSIGGSLVTVCEAVGKLSVRVYGRRFLRRLGRLDEPEMERKVPFLAAARAGLLSRLPERLAAPSRR